MSTFEYNDLYLLCQDIGKYHMFVFDILSTLHKKETIEDLNRLRKELKIPNK